MLRAKSINSLSLHMLIRALGFVLACLAPVVCGRRTKIASSQEKGSAALVKPGDSPLAGPSMTEAVELADRSDTPFPLNAIAALLSVAGPAVGFQPASPAGGLAKRSASLASTSSGAGAQEERRPLAIKPSDSRTGSIVASEADKLTQPVPVPDAYEPINLPDLATYEAMYKRSIDDPDGFWGDIARQFHWQKEWTNPVFRSNFKRSEGKVETTWFEGGVTNLAYNCLDRQIEAGRGDQVCFIAERNDLSDDAPQPSKYTYNEVLAEVKKMAAALRAKGVKKGDRVAIFMPMVAELPIAMLACARIGAVHSVVFGGFSPEALAVRMEESGAKALITCDGVMRGKKRIALWGIAAKAIAIAEKSGTNIEATIMLQRTGLAESDPALDSTPCQSVQWWHEATAAATDADGAGGAVEWVDSEHPLFILYTSGSTGKPKGVLHTTGGYMVSAATSFKYVFDVHSKERNDVFFCTADCGWITGHSYVAYGPLLNGATQVIFEGVPSYPGFDRLWQIVDKHSVTHLYTAPTAIRSLMGQGEEIVKKYSRKSLRLLGSVGEPINPEAWRWYHEVVGDSRCPIVDTWWQTETGAIMIAPLPAKGWDQVPGSATYPFFGVQPALLDAEGKEITDQAAEGLLAMKAPWPSTIRSCYGNHQRMEETYFPFDGYYLTGDGARRDAQGRYTITGRVDDVIIVSGHNIGTAEVESALVAESPVAEAAVVGVPHDVKGSALYCYVTLNEGEEATDDLRQKLRIAVRTELGAFAAPDAIHWAPGLPKTRSGKIMRRVLRKIAEKGKTIDKAADLGDTSTLADPSVVDTLIESYGK